MRIRLAVAVAVVGFVAASCSSDDAAEESFSDRAPAAAPPVAAAPTTIDRNAAALDAAAEACEFGDVATVPGTLSLRRALEMAGGDVEELTDDEIVRVWAAFAERNAEEADRLQLEAMVERYEQARDAAARAAAFDAQWADLHRGLSNYAAYLDSEFSDEDSDTVQAWFGDIRLGCERARALR